jgi:threonine synthase
MRWLGLARKIPRLVAVQATGCSPIEHAFRSNTAVKAWENAETIASAICDPLRGYKQDGERVVSVLKMSGGGAVAVADEEMLESVRMLAATEGIFAEPAGGASLAGLRKLVRTGKIGRGDRVVCVVTGHGLKDPGAASWESAGPRSGGPLHTTKS